MIITNCETILPELIPPFNKPQSSLDIKQQISMELCQPAIINKLPWSVFKNLAYQKRF